MKVEVFNFIIKHGHNHGRRMMSFKIEDEFGQEGYRYYQDLWKGGYLRYSVWGYVLPTKKGYLLERELKGWDRTSNNSRKDENG